MEAFATLDDLEGRLDFDLTEAESRMAQNALEDASDMVRDYGRTWPDPFTAPRTVRTVVLAACVRYMKNIDGYVSSKAGDETITWSDLRSEMGAVSLNDREIKLITKLAGRSGLASAPMVAWGTKNTAPEGYVPTEGGGKAFPLYTSDTSPW